MGGGKEFYATRTRRRLLHLRLLLTELKHNGPKAKASKHELIISIINTLRHQRDGCKTARYQCLVIEIGSCEMGVEARHPRKRSISVNYRGTAQNIDINVHYFLNHSEICRIKSF
jgi:hypothetical protein